MNKQVSRAGKILLFGMMAAVLFVLLPAGQAGADSDPFIAEVMCGGWNFCPRGWAECNGQILSIAQNTALFSLIGTTFGGDGRTTFGLPDLRGRAILHPGQGPGLSNRRWGDKGGAETHALTAGQVPAHSDHTVYAMDTDATSPVPQGNAWAQSTAGDPEYVAVPANDPIPDQVQMKAGAIGKDTAGQPHNIMQPYLTIKCCIAVQGIYPSRS